jgi:hypothetical protein
MPVSIVAATDLLLHPSVFSASPDAHPAQVADFYSWLDLVAAPVTLVSLFIPAHVDRFLGWRLLMTWPRGGPLQTPPGASTPVQPILIVSGLAAGCYAAVAALTVLMFPVAVFGGAFSILLLSRTILRPIVAWALLAAVARGFPRARPAA